MDAELDEMQLKNVIQLGLKRTFGIMGSSIPVDLLQFKDKIFFLRTRYDSAFMIKATLPTISEYAGEKCSISVDRASPSLPSVSIL
jgi:hypothetical protein